MKTVKLVLISVVVILVGCGGSSSHHSSEEPVVESLESVDLTGTWEVKTETRYYNITTNDYVYSQFNTNRLIIQDSAPGVLFRRCELEFGPYSNYGVKVGNRLYLGLSEDGYDYLGGNQFRQVGVIQQNQWSSEYYKLEYQYVVTLTKISDEVRDVAGALVLEAPWANTPDVRTCVSEYYASVGVKRTFFIQTVEGDNSLSFGISSESDFPVGTYQWEEYSQSNTEILDVSVEVPYELFESVTGSYYTRPKSGEVTISENSSDVLAGSFDLIDENGIEFKGSFNWNKNW